MMTSVFRTNKSVQHLTRTLLGVASVVAVLAQAEAAEPAVQRPNIILCMADDLGWGDLGFHGHPEIKTPNLDAMAKAGARLDRFYVGAPLCIPSRAAFLTGRNAVRCGMGNERGAITHLRSEEVTIAELVKAQGYATGHFGKWHLGMLTPDYRGEKSVLMTPGMSGFDEWFSSPSAVATHHPYIHPGPIGNAVGGRSDPQPIDLRAGYIHNGKPLEEPLEGCPAEIVMDRALSFIRKNASGDQPFLAVVWFNPPHTPVVGHPKYMAEYYSHLPENLQHYYSVVTAVDAQMGRLRETLRELGIADNTLVTFASDNGPGPPVGRDRNPDARLQGSTGPFRERKASLYEGGVRVPGLVEWPGKIQPDTVITAPCSTLDYLPTIASLLGIKLPDRPYDGINILPLLTGKQQERGRSIGFHFRDALAWSGERFKLIAAEQGRGQTDAATDFENKRFELFDLSTDPGESQDLSAQHPDVVQSMKAELKEWVDSVEKSRVGKDYEDATSATTPAAAAPATMPTKVATAVPAAPADKTRLFLLSGQSNMANMDPDVSFMPELRKAFPDDELIMVKVAYGGRPIARWVPRGKIYSELLEKTKQAIEGKKVDSVTFVWMQGERDHQEDDTTRTYRDNLKTLYQQLTEDLGREDIHWVIGRLSDARLGTPNWDTIRQIQVDVAEEHPLASWIDTDDLNGPNNEVHCPPEGYAEMGRRFAQAAIDLIGQSAGTKTQSAVPEGVNIRIIPLAKPLNDQNGFAQWMYPDQYTAQDILELIAGLKPTVLERFITGKQNYDAPVPVREGSPPMTVGQFLNAATEAGAPDCVIIPKLNLTWITWGREAYFWEAAQNNFDLPLDRPIRIVNLDNWLDYLNKHGEDAARKLLQRLKDIGYEQIGVNMAGGYREGYGYFSFADFLINSQTWEIRLSTLEKLKNDPHINQYYLYIDYPGQMNNFMQLSVDQQADVITKTIRPAEKEHGFTFVYPILFDAWDATRQKTSSDGPYQGATLYEVIQASTNPG
ncbi:sulfatase-like hydrolase/transferase [Planctomicrobium sp. SH661]|uniref:sulfatase-like hydrolase/transferase n=1 Tax=Planctomicrobium sp. SH661 TaxID=3448124 RepID=UPI003F5BED25